RERDAVHAEADIERLPERQGPGIAARQADARREQRPDEELGRDADPEISGKKRPGGRNRDHDRDQGDETNGARQCERHRVAPATRPCGRTSRTTLMNANETLRAVVGSAKLVTRPSSTASRTAAATVPWRFPRPPIITAMKHTGRISTSVRNSTVVIGAAITPPSSAIAVPSAKVKLATCTTGIPSVVAVSGSCRTARIQVPSLVRLRNRKNATRQSTAKP